MSHMQWIAPKLRELWLQTRRHTLFSRLPQNGWRCYRTDLSGFSDSPEWFFYDSKRGKWLSERVFDVTFWAPSGRSGFLDFHGIQSSATLGYMIPYDWTIVGMWIHRDATGVGETYRITADGVDKAQTNINAAPPDNIKSLNMSLNLDGTVKDIIGCRLLTGSTAQDVVVQARFRRRII